MKIFFHLRTNDFIRLFDHIWDVSRETFLGGGYNLMRQCEVIWSVDSEIIQNTFLEQKYDVSNVIQTQYLTSKKSML